MPQVCGGELSVNTNKLVQGPCQWHSCWNDETHNQQVKTRRVLCTVHYLTGHDGAACKRTVRHIDEQPEAQQGTKR